MMNMMKRTIALCLAIVLLGLSAVNVFAITAGDWTNDSFALSNAAVTVNATDAATAVINFTNKVAIEAHSAINGTFSVKGYKDSSCTTETESIVLSNMNPAADFSLGSLDNNAVATGNFSFTNNNNTDIAQDTVLWSATYTVAANTPTGTYYVKLSPVAVSDLLDNSMSNETYIAPSP